MLDQVDSDWVVVCTPPAMHREHTRLALAAGRHVFCEKPLAESLSDAAVHDRRRPRGEASARRQQRVPVHGVPPGGTRADRATGVRATTLHPRFAHHERGGSPGSRMARQRCSVARARVWRSRARSHALLLRRRSGATVRADAAPQPAVVWDAINIVALEFPDGRSASHRARSIELWARSGTSTCVSTASTRRCTRRSAASSSFRSACMRAQPPAVRALPRQRRKPCRLAAGRCGSVTWAVTGSISSLARRRSCSARRSTPWPRAAFRPCRRATTCDRSGLVFAAYDSAASSQPIDVASYLAPYVA